MNVILWLFIPLMMVRCEDEITDAAQNLIGKIYNGAVEAAEEISEIVESITESSNSVTVEGNVPLHSPDSFKCDVSHSLGAEAMFYTEIMRTCPELIDHVNTCCIDYLGNTTRPHKKNPLKNCFNKLNNNSCTNILNKFADTYGFGKKNHRPIQLGVNETVKEFEDVIGKLWNGCELERSREIIKRCTVEFKKCNDRSGKPTEECTKNADKCYRTILHHNIDNHCAEAVGYASGALYYGPKLDNERTNTGFGLVMYYVTIPLRVFSASPFHQKLIIGFVALLAAVFLVILCLICCLCCALKKDIFAEDIELDRSEENSNSSINTSQSCQP